MHFNCLSELPFLFPQWILCGWEVSRKLLWAVLGVKGQSLSGHWHPLHTLVLFLCFSLQSPEVGGSCCSVPVSRAPLRQPGLCLAILSLSSLGSRGKAQHLLQPCQSLFSQSTNLGFQSNGLRVTRWQMCLSVGDASGTFHSQSHEHTPQTER